MLVLELLFFAIVAAPAENAVLQGVDEGKPQDIAALHEGVVLANPAAKVVFAHALHKRHGESVKMLAFQRLKILLLQLALRLFPEKIRVVRVEAAHRLLRKSSGILVLRGVNHKTSISDLAESVNI